MYSHFTENNNVVSSREEHISHTGVSKEVMINIFLSTNDGVQVHA
jgi:hypothetical protein